MPAQSYRDFEIYIHRRSAYGIFPVTASIPDEERRTASRFQWPFPQVTIKEFVIGVTSSFRENCTLRLFSYHNAINRCTLS